MKMCQVSVRFPNSLAAGHFKWCHTLNSQFKIPFFFFFFKSRKKSSASIGSRDKLAMPRCSRAVKGDKKKTIGYLYLYFFESIWNFRRFATRFMAQSNRTHYKN